jgi:hypothetical protein
MNIVKINSIIQSPYKNKINTYHPRIPSKHKRHLKRTYILCYNDNNTFEKTSKNVMLHNDEKQVVQDNHGLFISSTLVLSSILFLSTSIVLILSAREMNIEAERFQERYDKLQADIKHLEEKNIQDELMINAIVGRMIELKSIGIV